MVNRLGGRGAIKAPAVCDAGTSTHHIIYGDSQGTLEGTLSCLSAMRASKEGTLMPFFKHPPESTSEEVLSPSFSTKEVL